MDLDTALHTALVDDDIKKHCHVNLNEDGDRFVGIKADSDNAMVYFPIGYQLPETDNEIRTDIKHLIQVLSEFTTSEDRLLAINKFAAPQSVDFPINAYKSVIEYYFSIGGKYYVEVDPTFKTSATGKQDWPRTVRNQVPLVQQKGGIALDMAVVENAIVFDKHSKDKLTAKIQNSENPNSVIQMKAWLLENGIEADTLDKKAVKELIRSTPAHIREVLEIRQKLAKSSVKKYQAMENAVCTDHRARGMFRFYGANRSGRWAGRMIQLQNLPQNHLPDLWEARELVKTGNYEAMEFLYDDIPDTLSQLIRTVFVPREGMKFVVADFSVIEARVLSYLAKEEWRSEVFRNNGDIYCASASAMFGVPVEKHGVNAHLRQKGKIAELALGYGGSVGALTAMGAIEMGLTEDELQPLVDSWRSANPNIVQFWWAVDRCVKKNISTQKHTVFIFYYKSGMLFIELPSGRRLSYVKPKMGVNKFGSESVVYEGIGGTKKWEQIESYGPKFMENIVQAISRDILAYAMRTLSHCFICGHVHDELIIECTKDVSLDAICEQMGRTPSWIPGLLLRADGYECDFYKKD